MKILLHVLVVAVALLAAAYTIPGIEVASFYVALISAVIIGLLNLVIRPILFVLTLPITIITFGLFALVLNALIFWFAASFMEGFDVAGFLPALLGSLVVSLASAVSGKLIS
jgi:putative membrane protein